MTYNELSDREKALYHDRELTKEFLKQTKIFQRKIVGTTLFNKELKERLQHILQSFPSEL